MCHIQERYPDRMFKVGDLVLATHKHGNLGNSGYVHIPREYVGVIEKVFHIRDGSKGNINDNYPYKVSGHCAGWAEDEIQLISVAIVKKGLKSK